MKYLVGARWWNEDLQKDFGEKNYTIVRDLSGDEVVALIRKHGRASISPIGTQKEYTTRSITEAEYDLYFENDYD